MRLSVLAPIGLAAAAILSSSATAQTDAPPICNPGGPYAFECSGPDTVAQLDASLSFDPDGTPLTYFWFVDPLDDCGFVTIVDPASPTPTLILRMGVSCFQDCEVHVRVSSGGQNRTCGVMVAVSDTQAPVITCPPDLTEIWTNGYLGSQAHPAATGYATASDCAGTLPVTYTDVVTHGIGIFQPEDIIIRTWTATDNCGFAASCQQVITLLRPGNTTQTYYLDALKGSCPNVLDVNQNSGLFPATIYARAGFPVSNIDQSTLVLARADNVGGNVVRMSKQVKDSGRPTQNDPCDCDGLKDSLPDLNLSMALPTVITTLALDQEPTGSSVVLVLYFKTLEGNWHTTRDCITIDRQ